MEEDQLTVTLRMLAEGQQMLTDILSQLDKLPAQRTVKVNIASDTGSGGMTAASDAVTNDVAKMNKSMMTMPGVAQETSSKVSSSMGSKGMGGAFSETKGNLNQLTGGMMGFLPMMAGMSLVSATGQFDALAKSIQQFKVMSGTSAEDASKWVGVANIYGLSTNSLSMAMKGLEQHQESLQTTFNKTTGSGVAASIALDGVKKANLELSISEQKVVTDQEKVNAAISKYGKGSVQAQTAEQSLETAQTHRITAQQGLLRAQDEYAKATGNTNVAMSTMQLAEQRLGINLLDNHGKMVSQQQILMEMADAYTRTGGSAQTVADITAILGGRAKALLPMFAQGSQGIKDAMQQTEQAGLVMNQSQLSVGVSSGKMMSDIKENIKSLFVGIGTALLPVFDFVDAHVKVFTDIAGAALAIFATVKVWKVGEGFVKDIGSLYKSITGISGAAGSIVSKITGGPGRSAAQKIIGAQVTVAVFGEAAFAQLKEASGGGLPGGNPLKTAEGDAAGAAETAGGVGVGEAATAGGVMEIVGGIVGSAAFLPAIGVVGAAALAWFGAQSIINEHKKSQATQNKDIASVRADYDPKNTGSNALKNGLVDPTNNAAVIAQQKKDYDAIHITAQSVLGSWDTINSSMLDTQTHILAWEEMMRPTLKGQLVAGSNTTVAMDDIAKLVQKHVITNATTLAAYESDWNNIQLNTGKTAPQAQTMFEQMLASKQVTTAQAPQYIAAWNALVNQGLDPASINAQEVNTQIALAAADAKLLHANLQADNNIPGVTVGGGTTGQPSRVVKYASGGLISEHIVGIGQKTGTQYHFGEAGNEGVIPLDNGASGGSAAQPIPVGNSGGGAGGGGVVVQVSFPNSLTFLNNANQIDELARAIEARFATVRLPHRGVRMSPH